MVNAISTYPSFMGSAPETTYGTAVGATLFTPATSIASEDVRNYVPDTAMRGSAVDAYNQVSTQGWGTFAYDFPVFMDTIGVPLIGILGDQAVTGAGPYVHTASVKNSGDLQPPSYTLVDYNGYEGRQFAGCVFSQVQFTFGATALLTASAQATGLPSTAIAKPTQTFSGKTALAAYLGVVKIAGSTVSQVESGTFTITRAVNPITAINGSANPVQIWGGAVSVAASLTCLYKDDTFLTPMLNGTSTSVELQFTNGADILDLKSTNTLFTKAPVTRNGNGWMEITVDVAAVANTTDAGASGGYSPVKATLTNTTSGSF